VKPPQLLALHDHNEIQISSRIADRLAAGEDVALVSDAGTPLLADPGYPLLGECYQRGIAVVPVPGPSALACALAVCPLPTADFCFLGFLPSRSAARRSRLETHLSRGPVVFFEAPHRIAACLADLAELFGRRRVFLGREMTKKFESYLCGRPDELLETLQETDALRGEFVVVVEGPDQNAAVHALTAAETMQVLSRHLPPTQAARIGAELLGIPRRELYRLAGHNTGEES
jgi:16S rRNA (cytidine1402-2'-O)-methyltransferase